MMKKLRYYLNSYWGIFFIFFIWLTFSGQYFFYGKVPYPSSYQVNNFAPWSAYSKFWGPVKNGAMPDIITQIYPWKKLTIDTWKMGQIPLWNPYSFTGTSHLANYQSAVLSPFNLLFFIFPFVDAWTLLVLLQPLLAGVFTYIFARSVLLSKPASLICSVSFMFCGFLTTWMGYATLGYAILFLPLTLYAIEMFYKTKQTRYRTIIIFSIPLSFFSGHFQISLYFLIFIIAYFLYKFIQEDNRKISLEIIFAVISGLLISAIQIVPSIEAYTQALRSTIFEKGEVIPWQYLPTLLAPDFFGNPVTRNDWFGHYAEWNAYIGVIPLLLAFYAILNRKNLQTLFFLTCSFLAILLAFDTPLLNALISLRIPVLSTSAASRIIVLYSFCFAVLAGIGFDALVENIKSKNKRHMYVHILLTSLIFLLLWSIVQFKLFISTEKISISKSNLILPTILAFCFSFTTLVSLFYRKRVVLLLSLLLLFTAFDMVRFVTKWMPFDPKMLVFPQIPVTKYFSSISNYDRVIGNLGGEATIYYKLPSLEGYDAVYPKRYGEFIASLSDGKIKNAYRSVVLFPKDGKYSLQALQLLGVRYVIHKISDDHKGWTFPFWIYPAGMFTQVYKDEAYEVYKNNNAFPRVFLAQKYEIASDNQKIIDRLFAKDFPLQQKVLLEEDPHYSLTSSGNAKIIQYTPNNVVITTNIKGNSLLILTDNYYPGWQAFVDGTETKIFRADYTFRAIAVSQGSHIIKFSYNPFSFRIGLYLSLLGMGISSVLFLRKSR